MRRGKCDRYGLNDVVVFLRGETLYFSTSSYIWEEG